MKTNTEQVAHILQSMHNQARLIIEKRGEVNMKLWQHFKIFMKNGALMVSDKSECNLFTQRPIIDQAMILDHLNRQERANTCNHSNAYYIHNNTQKYCPDCDSYLNE